MAFWWAFTVDGSVPISLFVEILFDSGTTPRRYSLLVALAFMCFVLISYGLFLQSLYFEALVVLIYEPWVSDRTVVLYPEFLGSCWSSLQFWYPETLVVLRSYTLSILVVLLSYTLRFFFLVVLAVLVPWGLRHSAVLYPEFLGHTVALYPRFLVLLGRTAALYPKVLGCYVIMYHEFLSRSAALYL